MEEFFSLTRIEEMIDLKEEERNSYIKSLYHIVETKGLVIKDFTQNENLYDRFKRNQNKNSRNIHKNTIKSLHNSSKFSKTKKSTNSLKIKTKKEASKSEDALDDFLISNFMENKKPDILTKNFYQDIKPIEEIIINEEQSNLEAESKKSQKRLPEVNDKNMIKDHSKTSFHENQFELISSLKSDNSGFLNHHRKASSFKKSDRQISKIKIKNYEKKYNDEYFAETSFHSAASIPMVVPDRIEDLNFYLQFFALKRKNFNYYVYKSIFQAFKYLNLDKLYFSFLEIICIIFCSSCINFLNRKIVARNEMQKKNLEKIENSVIEDFILKIHEKQRLFSISIKKFKVDSNYSKLFKYQNLLSKLKFCAFDKYQKKVFENLVTRSIENCDESESKFILSYEKEDKKLKEIFELIRKKEFQKEVEDDLIKFFEIKKIICDMIIKKGFFDEKMIRSLEILGIKKNHIDSFSSYVDHLAKKAGILKKKLLRKEIKLEFIEEEILNNISQIKQIKENNS